MRRIAQLTVIAALVGGILAATWTSRADAQTPSYGQRVQSAEFGVPSGSRNGSIMYHANKVYVSDTRNPSLLYVFSPSGTRLNQYTLVGVPALNYKSAIVGNEIFAAGLGVTGNYIRVFSLDNPGSSLRTLTMSGFRGAGTAIVSTGQPNKVFVSQRTSPYVVVATLNEARTTLTVNSGDGSFTSAINDNRVSGLAHAPQVLISGMTYTDVLYSLYSATIVRGYTWDRNTGRFNRQSALDLNLSTLSNRANVNATDIAFDGSRLLVVDDTDDRIYAYYVAAPQQAAGSPSLTAEATSITVTWEAPELEAGQSLGLFDLRYRIATDEEWTELASVTSSVSGRTHMYTIRNLVPLTDYEVAVRATINSVKGQWSASHTVETMGAYGHLLPAREEQAATGAVALPTPEGGSTVAPSTEGGFGVQPYRRAIAGLPAGTMWLVLSTIFGVAGGALFRRVNGSMMTRAGIMCLSQVVFALILGEISTALLHLTILGTFSVGAISSTTGSGGRRDQ